MKKKWNIESKRETRICMTQMDLSPILQSFSILFPFHERNISRVRQKKWKMKSHEAPAFIQCSQAQRGKIGLKRVTVMKFTHHLRSNKHSKSETRSERIRQKYKSPYSLKSIFIYTIPISTKCLDLLFYIQFCQVETNFQKF